MLYPKEDKEAKKLLYAVSYLNNYWNSLKLHIKVLIHLHIGILVHKCFVFWCIELCLVFSYVLQLSFKFHLKQSQISAL